MLRSPQRIYKMNHPTPYAHQSTTDVAEIDLKALTQTLIAHKFILLACLFLGFVLSFTFAILKPTVYQSSALVQVTAQKDPTFGKFSMMAPSANLTLPAATLAAATLNNQTTLATAALSNEANNAVAAQNTIAGMMQSSYILQPVIDNLGLNLSVKPKYFPLIGLHIALQYQGDGAAPARFGLTSYAWGGESLIVNTFNVPSDNFKEKFIVKVIDNDHYALYEGSHLVLQGMVHKPAVNSDGTISILISKITARAGTEFYVCRYSDNDVLSNLQEMLSVTQVTVGQFNNATSLIKLSLKNTSATNAPMILNAITDITSKNSAIAKASLMVLNPASPADPLPSSTLLIALAGAFGGFIIGVLFILVRHAFNTGMTDPYVLEREFGLRTLAVTPWSDTQAKNKKLFDQKKLNALPILTKIASNDPTIESLDSLGASLPLILAKKQGKLITLSSPIPQVGTSFIALNLAATLAESGKKVLLLDADLRQGCLHAYFKKSITPGLSELLLGATTLDKALQPTEFKHLDFMSCGAHPTHSLNLLLSDTLPQLLLEIEKHYDFVIIDTPPILAAPDATLIAKYCALNFMVVAAGKIQTYEVEIMLKQFYNQGVQLDGTIFNFTSKEIQAASKYNHQKYYARYRQDQ